ncbi:MAG: helix-turn-helix transcriptional regulator [Clostridia bacterium]|nr:helix-turn-helix transcriptional regulator [Clostridia bacterium]
MVIDILSDLIITDVYHASTFYNAKDASGKRTKRPRWMVLYKMSGKTVYRQNGAELVSREGCVAILPKGSSYDWRCTENGYYAAVEFESDTECDELFVLPVQSGEKIYSTIKKLETKRASAQGCSRVESIRDTYSVLLAIIRTEIKKYVPTEKHLKISPALDYISEHYSEKITNDALADMCGISTVYFRRLFTEVMGQSPIDYVHTLRIKKAKEILMSDYGSVSDIATSLGYQSIYDFSRAFKLSVGVSPRAFRAGMEK